MSLWSKFLSWVEITARHWRGGEAASAGGRRPRVDSGAAVMAGMIGGASGQSYPGGWFSDRLELVNHYRHWSYIAIRAIANEISGLTPRVALVLDGDRFGKTHVPYHRKSVDAIGDHEEIREVGPQHPLARLFREPNPWDVSCDLWYELMLFLELCGIAYVWAPPNRAGLPAQLWVIPSHWVWRKMGPVGVRYYEVRPIQGGGVYRFPVEEVIELRYKSPLHKIDGWSSQQAGSEWIDAAESIDRSRFHQFENGCFPSGAVELGEGYHDPDDQDLERIYAKFFARLQGTNKFGVPIILPPGAKYNPLTISPVEMSYHDSADQFRDWVLALFGVPKEVAGIQDAGSEIAMYGPLLQFGRLTIVPKLRYLGQALTRHLASRYDPQLRVWWEYELPVSPQQVNADLTLDAANGMILPEEYRATRGRRPYTPAEEEKYSQIGKGQAKAPGSPGAVPLATSSRAYVNGRHT